jgi:imidazolonepropionase-like amidohydrolase
MSNALITNATVLDVVAGKLRPASYVEIAGGRIKATGAMRALPADRDPALRVIDAAGKTVMPGLIDAHVHVIAWTANFRDIANNSPHLNAFKAAEVMHGMLNRGFTTVRDASGADFGLQRAVEEGYIKGPRLFICGRALSQTGGHSDKRLRGELDVETMSTSTSNGHIVDGVPAVRQACREEVRRGANHIKLMLGGGIASPTDRLTNDQFSIEEIKAAVEEAAMADLYVMAHTYTARAVNRAIECGVHSLEHCNLIDQSSIKLFLKHKAWMVPTLIVYQALAKEGVAAGLPRDLEPKIYLVLDKGLGALEMAYKAGVKLAYGTDLLGKMHRLQAEEFAIRAQVQPNIEVIRAATTYAAELVRASGELGVIAPGAQGDVIMVDGDPLKDINVLAQPDKYLKLVMRGGEIVVNRL